MSGMEVVAVIGCVAAVVSAYKDGGKIVKSIKERRAAKKAPVPTASLETSLDRGPVAVGEARDSGIERYGSSFATGDQVAIDALRNILIHLQGTLLRHLWAAQEDDNMTDFNILVDASDFGRIQSVTVLNELYMRMATAAPLRQAVLPASGRIEILKSSSSFDLPWEHQPQASQATPFIPSLQPASPVRSAQIPNEQILRPNSEDIAGPPIPKRKWGIFSASRSNKELTGMSSKAFTTRSDSDEAGFVAVEDEPYSSESTLGIQFGNQSPVMPKHSSRTIIESSPHIQSQVTGNPSLAASWQPSPEMVIDEDNPWALETSTMSRNVTNAESPPEINSPQRRSNRPRRTSTESTLVNTSETTAGGLRCTQKDVVPISRPQDTPEAHFFERQQDTKRPVWKIPLMPRRRMTSETVQTTAKLIPNPEGSDTPKGSPTISRTQSSPQTPKKTAAKDPCGGFCIGAYKLQMGLEKESVKLKSQSTSMTGQSNYWGCINTRCVFEAPALKTGKIWTFDDNVHRSDTVQFRWTFLAKSHVSISKSKNRRYSYKCVFCDPADQTRTVHTSEKAFIEHVSSHRGQQTAIVNSAKVMCITGRVATDQEDFDINFIPYDDVLGIPRHVFDDTPNALSISPALSNTEDDGVFQWQAIKPSFGMSRKINNSVGSRTLSTVSGVDVGEWMVGRRSNQQDEL